jgi:DNA-binding beta-propeller fold protein YncE
MKTILFSLFILFFIGTGHSKAQRLEKVWETSVELKTPESVLYHEDQDVVYVANMNGNPSDKNGNGFISVLNPDGTVKVFKWIENLNAPKGMALYKGRLYVADIDQLVEIDIEHGEILKKFDATDAVFLNDVAACRNGMIFVSDSRAAKIYVLYKGQFTVWLEGDPFAAPNGLFTENGDLFVGDKSIYKVDISSKEVTQIVKDAGGVDGLEKNNEGQFVFSHWAGRIFIHKDGRNIKIHDSTAQEINSADIDFALKYNWLLVPTFFDNRVVAYKVVD